MKKRRAAVVVFVLVLATVSAATALAYRKAMPRTVVALKKVLTTQQCAGTSVNVVDALVSTANPRYALVVCGDRGHFTVFLRRPTARSERWHVVFEIGDGVEPCSLIRRHLPIAVIRDFHLGGIKGRRQGQCAPRAGGGFAAAKHQWELAPCQAEAVEADYWRRAATALRRRPRHAGAAKAIRELNTLVSLPENGVTTAQARAFIAAAQGLNRFFSTPGNLIGTHEYCS